jgi:hypothetical protein
MNPYLIRLILVEIYLQCVVLSYKAYISKSRLLYWMDLFHLFHCTAPLGKYRVFWLAHPVSIPNIKRRLCATAGSKRPSGNFHLSDYFFICG